MKRGSRHGVREMKIDASVRKRWKDWIVKNKYVFLVVAVGVVIMLLPVSSGGKTEQTGQTSVQESTLPFSLEEQEQKLERLLEQIPGVGKATVMLALKNGGRQILAENTDASQSESGTERTVETVILSGSGGEEKTVTLQYIAPEYAGAVIVAEGAQQAEIQLKITNAVRSVTGLSSDRITVIC